MPTAISKPKSMKSHQACLKLWIYKLMNSSNASWYIPIFSTDLYKLWFFLITKSLEAFNQCTVCQGTSTSSILSTVPWSYFPSNLTSVAYDALPIILFFYYYHWLVWVSLQFLAPCGYSLQVIVIPLGLKYHKPPQIGSHLIEGQTDQ